MRHLNYNHLLYFWTVARDGSIAKAAEVLHITPQTISGQIKLLEETVGGPLFNRVGRRLEPSDLGKLVYGYADEIFSIGTELAQVVKGKISAMPSSLVLGVTDTVPKLIAYRMIEPALAMDPATRVICREGSLENLLAELAVHRLDVVLSDSPLMGNFNVRAYNHVLGESHIAFFAPRRTARRLAKGFPGSLDGMPMLLPVADTPLRRSLDEWFELHNIHPIVVGEFADTALLKAFGRAGAGVFPGSAVMEEEICRMYRVETIGATAEVRERYYAISPERRLKHPAVVAISEQSQERLLAVRD
jgi:LysR family transcriptional activator of nhaA